VSSLCHQSREMTALACPPTHQQLPLFLPFGDEYKRLRVATSFGPVRRFKLAHLGSERIAPHY
jgi:hypothetical protein